MHFAAHNHQGSVFWLGRVPSSFRCFDTLNTTFVASSIFQLTNTSSKPFTGRIVSRVGKNINSKKTPTGNEFAVPTTEGEIQKLVCRNSRAMIFAASIESTKLVNLTVPECQRFKVWSTYLQKPCRGSVMNSAPWPFCTNFSKRCFFCSWHETLFVDYLRMHIVCPSNPVLSYMYCTQNFGLSRCNNEHTSFLVHTYR